MTEECEDVTKWKKRLRRKGPFHLLRLDEETYTEYYDFSVTPPLSREVPKNVYVVIWNDKEKTKIGSFSDYMYCRYGVATLSVLRGDTPFDLWNGQHVDQEDFDAMLAVRNGLSDLPHFDLDVIKGLHW